MGLVIALVLVILLVGGFVTFIVVNATRKGGPVADDADTPGVGTDESPLGDTTEHAGERSTEGTTVGRHDAAVGHDPPDRDAAAHISRPGEAEGRERLEFEGEQPAVHERP